MIPSGTLGVCWAGADDGAGLTQQQFPNTKFGRRWGIRKA